MRRAIASLLTLMMLAGDAWAVDYYVRTDGSDTLCNGTANVAQGVADPNCAFASVNKAWSVVNCTTPDKIIQWTGEWTVTSPIRFPTTCLGPDIATPVIWEGQGDATVTRGDLGMSETLAGPSSQCHNQNCRSRFITVRNMKLVNSSDDIVDIDSFYEGLTFDNVTFEHDGGGASSGTGAHFLRIGENGNAFGFRLTNSRFVGTQGLLSNGVTGTSAMGIRHVNIACSACTIPSTPYFTGNTFTGVLGAIFDGNFANGYIRDNIIDGSNCGPGDENSCIQLYNSPVTVVSGNLAKNISPNGSTGIYFIKLRTTYDELATPPNNNERVSLIAYNNTIVGLASDLGATRKKQIIGIANSCDNGGVVGASCFNNNSAKSSFNNNVIMTNWGRDNPTYGTAYVAGTDIAVNQLLDCADAGFDFLNNLYFNVGWRDVNPNITTPNYNLLYDIRTTADHAGHVPGCPSTISGEISGVNPSLDPVTFLPDSPGDPVCGAGDTSLVAPDGDVSKSWIGYAAGACAGGPPVRTLTVNKTGSSGDGTISVLDPPGLTCAPGCSSTVASFDDLEVVTMTATPDATSIFTAFSGTGCGTTSPSAVTMSANRTCTAVFVNHCFDSVQDFTETCPDGGGACLADCANGQGCAVDADCVAASFCSGGVCTADPTCTDGILNQDEGCIDAGGSCASRCANGASCNLTSDCLSGSTCVGGPPGVCTAPPPPPQSIKVVGTISATGVTIH